MTDLAEEVGAFDVEAVALVEVGFGGGVEVLEHHDAGAGDQDVYFAELGHGLGDHELDVLEAAGVAFDEEGLLVADLLGDVLGRGRVGGVGDGDVGAGVGEEEGGGGADALAAAGDEGGLAGEGSGHGFGLEGEAGQLL